MFTLTLHDRNGEELKEGDIVRVISHNNRLQFYAEVKWLEAEQAIAPFHTCSFHSFEKVDAVPDNAVRTWEQRYGVWYVPGELQQEGEHKRDEHSQYLYDWLQCEHLLKKKCYRIKLATE